MTAAARGRAVQPGPRARKRARRRPRRERKRTMEHRGLLISGVGLTDPARRSHWPARLDLAQSASGLLLALFMWAHMAFVSSILLGKDAMWMVTKFFEGYFFFGRSYPGLVSTAVALVIALVGNARHSGRCANSRLTTVSSAPFAVTCGCCGTRTQPFGSGRWSPASPCSFSPRCTSTSCLPGPTVSGRSNRPTGSGATTSGRCISCYC